MLPELEYFFSGGTFGYPVIQLGGGDGRDGYIAKNKLSKTLTHFWWVVFYHVEQIFVSRRTLMRISLALPQQASQG